jgi:hypothetical protein
VHLQRTPISLNSVDAVAYELVRRPSLSELLGRPLPQWLDDLGLWNRVWTRIIGDLATHCWVWTAAKSSRGYGEIKLGGVQSSPYRVVYEWLVGTIPYGLVLDHLCQNRLCVNPAHMEPVTPGENTLRGQSPQALNRLKTHCPQGHPYDEANTIYLPDSAGRRCRICRDGYYAEHREHLRALKNAEYAARALAKGKITLPAPAKRTHCKRGHKYTPENTYITLQGHRQCRECNRIADRKRYPQRAEEMKQRVRDWKRRHKETQ